LNKTLIVGVFSSLAIGLMVSLGLVALVLNSDLEAVRGDLAAALDQNNKLQGQIDGLNGDLENAQAEQERTQDELSRYEYLVCSSHDWDDVLQANGYFPLIGADEFLHSELQNYVFFTQWYADWIGPDWDPNLPVTTLLLDLDGEISFIFDTEEDCVIPNPAWWNSVDRSPSGSAFIFR